MPLLENVKEEKGKMKKKVVSGILLTLLLVSAIDFVILDFVAHADGSEGGSTDWWFMFRHDENHIGYSTELAPTRNDTTCSWNKTTNGAVYSSPAVANDTVFVSSDDSYLYAFDLDGVKKWNVSLGGRVYSSPAVDGDIVFVALLNGSVYAINATNGNINWSRPTRGSVYSSPVVANGVVFIGSDDCNVYALNETNGEVIWSFPTGAPVRSSPAIADGRIFFGVDDGRVYALNATTFRYLWHFETGGSVSSSPATKDGVVFVGSSNGTVYALDETNGTKMWRFPTDEYIGPVHSSPAVAYGKVFIGSNDTNIYALDELDGTLIWNFPTGGAVCSSPAVANSTVFVGSSDFQVYALNETDGKVRWNYTTGGAVWSSPAVVAKKVFVGSFDEKVYAFEEPNIKPVPVINYYPENPIICQTVTFNGSDSYDPDGNITDWYWQFGDGRTANGKIVTHDYEAAGTYTVNLTVTDNGFPKATDSTSQLITVLEVWPMFRHDPTHAGYSISLSPVTNTPIWIKEIGPSISDDNLWSSPIVIDDFVYIASRNGSVYKLNASNGSVIPPWPVKPGGEIRSSPALYNDMVFVGSLDGYLYALNASSGETIWISDKFGGIESSPVVSEGVVFVGSQDNYVHALYAINGSIKWVSEDTKGDVASSPAVVGDIVFVGSDGKNVSAMNKFNHELNWTNQTGSWVRSSPAVAYGRVFVGSDDGYIYALDMTNGNIKWKCKIGTLIRSSPAVADGIVFIGSDDGNLYALNATTNNPNGEKIWNKTISSVGWLGWSSPAVAEGKVFIGTIEGKIYALSIKGNGFILWSYETGGAIDSSPAVFNDTLYIASKDGKLYAFSEQVDDIAVTEAIPSQSRVAQDQTIDITVSVENQGSFNETDINVTAQYNEDVFNSTSINLTRGEERSLHILWNTTYVPVGNYTIYVNATLAPPLTDNEPADNTKHFNVTVEIGVDDIAVINFTTCKDGCSPMPVVGQGYTAHVYVTVLNKGDFPETFNVTAYANSREIGTQEVTLNKGENRTLTFIWNTTDFAKGNYTVWAYAWPVSGETNTTDNTYPDGIVYVGIPGDINADGIVDVFDAVRLAGVAGLKPNMPEWDPNADINDDHIVDLFDAVILAGHAGEHDP